MNSKLFANLKRMTTGFYIGILCVTVSVLALRLTVFSDMAVPAPGAASNLISSQQDHYQINSRIYFSAANAKGDLFITNGGENLMKVDIVLQESGRSILSTGLINPGASMNSSRMNPDGQKLEDGMYQCTAKITTYAPDDLKKELQRAEEDVQIYIGEKPGDTLQDVKETP